MTRLHRANHTHYAFAAHDFALVANFLNAGAYLHWMFLVVKFICVCK